MILDVAIVGSGFGGLGAAVRLRDANINNFVVFERANDLGGTWRENTYPGCRCDVSSNLYSFSFAPNPNWTNTYSYQSEILQYLHYVASRYQLHDHIQFEHDVANISFDGVSRLWILSTNRGEFHARAVVLAVGGLTEPRMPEIEGIEEFSGSTMHTAKWDHSVSLANKRVGVIGTGASAIQLIPEIAGAVSHLDIFQRTPAWVLPHLGHSVKRRTRRLFAVVPFSQHLVRYHNYWRRELLVLGFVKDPSRMSTGEEQARLFIGAHVADPTLRDRLTPSYRMGCKRVLISNDFYPTVERDNVEVVVDAIERITAQGVRTRDGRLHELDVLILATGFMVTDNPICAKVHGADGSVLADAFRGATAHYKGTTFPTFPNLFMLGGPNTGLGHTSVIFMIESQLNYVVAALGTVLSRGALVQPTAQAADQWTTTLQEKFPGSVWGSGCKSWYLNDRDLNTIIWPDFTFNFRRATRNFNADDHEILV